MALTEDEAAKILAMYRTDLAEVLGIPQERISVRIQSIGHVNGEDTSQMTILIDGKEPSIKQAKVILAYSATLGGREMGRS